MYSFISSFNVSSTISIFYGVVNSFDTKVSELLFTNVLKIAVLTTILMWIILSGTSKVQMIYQFVCCLDQNRMQGIFKIILRIFQFYTLLWHVESNLMIEYMTFFWTRNLREYFTPTMTPNFMVHQSVCCFIIESRRWPLVQRKCVEDITLLLPFAKLYRCHIADKAKYPKYANDEDNIIWFLRYIRWENDDVRKT